LQTLAGQDDHPAHRRTCSRGKPQDTFALREDANATHSESGLPKCNARHRPNDVRAQGVRLPSAFITGQAFAGLPENARTQYVTGLVDGIFVAVLFGASQGRVSALERCLGGQDNKQIGANLLKYIQERPGEQREGAHVIFYRQMIEVCPGAGPAQ
jgi:hypothetical protein